MTSGPPPIVNFAPVREFPGERGFWNMAIGQDPGVPAPQRASFSTHTPPTGISPCALVTGIVVFLVLFWLMSQAPSCAKYQQKFVNGMRAITKTQPSNAPAKDHFIKLDDEGLQKSICGPGQKNCATNLTPCSSDDCSDIKNVNADYKKAADKAVIDFVQENKTCMLMIYAPWCPHCHTAMPKFIEASTKAKCPFGIINAELVSPQLLQGDSALFNVQFFPYIIRREQKGGEASDTVYKGAPTMEGYLKHAEMDKMDHFFF